MASVSPLDQKWMSMALDLARKGEGGTRPNPPVGSVIVKNNRIAGRGYHMKAGGPHAEIHALRDAGPAARGATLYVTLEPCCTWGRTPPCTEAIVAAGIARVVVACGDPNPKHRGRGLKQLARAGIEVSSGVMKAEAQELIAPFTRWIQSRRPLLTLKMAMTMDGKIADRKGHSRWISSVTSRAEVKRLRARSDGVMVGVDTACADDPSLLYKGRKAANLYRIIVDSKGRLPLTAKVLNDGASKQTVIATTAQCSGSRCAAYRKKGASVLVLPQKRGLVSLESLLSGLGRMGLLRILCEGGGRLASALVKQGLVDEYVFFMAPKFLGSAGSVPVLDGHSWLLGQEPQVQIVSCRQSGPDLIIRAVKKQI